MIHKSTSAISLMLGKHPIFAASVGLKSLMSYLSLDVKAEPVTDSSTCKGLCSRRVLRCGFNTPWHDDRLQSPDVRERTWLQMSGRRRASPKTPCGDCCLDWPRAKVEASFEHGRSASEGLRKATSRFNDFACKTANATFSIARASSESHVFCQQFAPFRSFSSKWFGMAGSLLFCNSWCDM